jgi:hypothetical protein
MWNFCSQKKSFSGTGGGLKLDNLIFWVKIDFASAKIDPGSH